MYTDREWFRRSVRAKKRLAFPLVLDPDYLKVSEWSDPFERYMHHRLMMGAFRYGLLHDPNKKQFNRLKSIEVRLQSYRDTGNDEFLVDIANLCMLEFEEGVHPNKHFASIDDGEHAQAIE